MLNSALCIFITGVVCPIVLNHIAEHFPAGSAWNVRRAAIVRNFLVPVISRSRFACRQYRFAVRSSYGCIWIIRNFWNGVPRLLGVIGSSMMDVSEIIMLITLQVITKEVY